MYDWPETSSALEVLWSGIKHELEARGIEAPDKLYHVEEQMPLWTDEALVIGQTCGWPYITKLSNHTVPFARFDYGLKNCPAGAYQSLFIGRSPDDAKYVESHETLLEVSTVAINGEDSQSGFQVFSEISGKPASVTIPSDKRVISGSHRASVRLVAEGSAQIAAIDAVAFELASRHDTDIAQHVAVIGRSKPKPGLPLITSARNADKAEELFIAVKQAVQTLDASVRDTLMIKGVVAASHRDYKVFAPEYELR